MKFDIPTETLEKAIKTFGKSAQVDMAIEEMSELTKALCKERRTGKAGYELQYPPIMDNVIEEIADVLIMMKQLIMIFYCEKEVEKTVEAKIARLEERLK